MHDDSACVPSGPICLQVPVYSALTCYCICHVLGDELIHVLQGGETPLYRACANSHVNVLVELMKNPAVAVNSKHQVKYLIPLLMMVPVAVVRAASGVACDLSED